MGATLNLAAVIAAGVMLYKGRDVVMSAVPSGEGWQKTHPEVRRRALAVLQDAEKAGLKVGIFEAWRPQSRQEQYIKNRTTWVEDWRESYHVWGLEVDFVFRDAFGRWTWEPAGGRAQWEKLGAIIERHGFTWGGRWRNFDGAHAQLEIEPVGDLMTTYAHPDNYVRKFT